LALSGELGAARYRIGLTASRRRASALSSSLSIVQFAATASMAALYYIRPFAVSSRLVVLR
jgi:hypothetical protein